MRALLVAAATSTTGGAERHIADLLRRLPDAGVTPELLCPEGGDLTVLAHDLGIRTYHAEIAAGMPRQGMADVSAAIRESDPDIVHVHGARAAFFARLSDSRARERLIYTVHGIHIDKAGSLPRRATFINVERALKRRTAHFVTVCESDIDKGRRLGLLDPRRTSVVHNGIELPAAPPAPGAFRAELGIDAGVPLALSVGRFHAQKDQRTLLDAWSRVIASRPDAVLALIGSGPQEGDLRAQAVALRTGDSLRFVPPRSDLAPAYVDADAFVLSSLWEGLPYVILEAMAYGTPVVSTSVDGIPEAISTPDIGRLVPPQDSAALAEAILSTLVLTPEARTAQTAVARERVATEFSLDTMVERLADVYAHVAHFQASRVESRR